MGGLAGRALRSRESASRPAKVPSDRRAKQSMQCRQSVPMTGAAPRRTTTGTAALSQPGSREAIRRLGGCPLSKLAIALQLMGLAAAAPAPGEINATLHSLGPSSGDAKCIDGSPAAFYLRPGTGSGASKWVVFHEGGGWCISLSDCRARANTTLGSSAGYAAELAMPDQLLSSNATINPLLYNWNVAYLSYCDGGSFVGDAVANDTQGGAALPRACHQRGDAGGAARAP